MSTNIKLNNDKQLFKVITVLYGFDSSTDYLSLNEKQNTLSVRKHYTLDDQKEKFEWVFFSNKFYTNPSLDHLFTMEIFEKRFFFNFVRNYKGSMIILTQNSDSLLKTTKPVFKLLLSCVEEIFADVQGQNFFLTASMVHIRKGGQYFDMFNPTQPLNLKKFETIGIVDNSTIKDVEDLHIKGVNEVRLESAEWLKSLICRIEEDIKAKINTNKKKDMLQKEHHLRFVIEGDYNAINCYEDSFVHEVLTIKLYDKNQNFFSKFNFVLYKGYDLTTKCCNKENSAFFNCILSDSYRDSKFTRLLQDTTKHNCFVLNFLPCHMQYVLILHNVLNLIETRKAFMEIDEEYSIEKNFERLEKEREKEKSKERDRDKHKFGNDLKIKDKGDKSCCKGDKSNKVNFEKAEKIDKSKGRQNKLNVGGINTVNLNINKTSFGFGSHNLNNQNSQISISNHNNSNNYFNNINLSKVNSLKNISTETSSNSLINTNNYKQNQMSIATKSHNNFLSNQSNQSNHQNYIIQPSTTKKILFSIASQEQQHNNTIKLNQHIDTKHKAEGKENNNTINNKFIIPFFQKPLQPESRLFSEKLFMSDSHFENVDMSKDSKNSKNCDVVEFDLTDQISSLSIKEIKDNKEYKETKENKENEYYLNSKYPQNHHPSSKHPLDSINPLDSIYSIKQITEPKNYDKHNPTSSTSNTNTTYHITQYIEDKNNDQLNLSLLRKIKSDNHHKILSFFSLLNDKKSNHND